MLIPQECCQIYFAIMHYLVAAFTSIRKFSTFFLKLFTALAAVAMTVASALELTPDNWDKATAGKTVFIKFLAPW